MAQIRQIITDLPGRQGLIRKIIKNQRYQRSISFVVRKALNKINAL